MSYPQELDEFAADVGRNLWRICWERHLNWKPKVMEASRS